MLSIVSSDRYPYHLQQLREWFVLEWGQIDPFDGCNAGFKVPAPLLAIDGNGLAGGLAFTSAPRPGGTEIAIWINALLVAPSHRGMGVGSRLVQAAEVAIADIGARELFVFTNIPGLYLKQGWRILESMGEARILARQLSNPE